MPPEISEAEARPAIPLEPSRPVTSLESARSIARRLDRSVRTIDRYVRAGILPAPIKVRKKRFWPAGIMPKPDDTP